MIAAIVALDAYVGYIVDAHRTPLFDTFFLWLTQLGDARWIMVIALSIVFVAWRHRRFEYKAGLAVALFGALLASYLIKIVVQRPRPDTLHALLHLSDYSFPSMHAAVSLAVYGYLAYTTWRLMHPPHHRAPWVAILGALIVLVGFSRVYLGVHYFSDVIGGYAIGALFLWLGILVTDRLSQRRSGG